MRTLTKRLTCVNRDDSAKNHAAIEAVISRYVAKMEKKGWKLDPSYRFGGNAFLKYEAYIRLTKGE